MMPAVVEHAELRLGAVEEPVEREAAPGQRRKQRVVEGEHARRGERRGEIEEEGEHVGAVGPEEQRLPAARRRSSAQPFATVVARLWPVSLRPSQTASEVNASSSTPKVAPYSQL